ncbi:GNAT family N-acetyltransferase [Sutcliffiella deserti]|uniref:GNAT family N-acetyltransferase n=1 Tax=Sutcliffiella deserti TaxID=2875501 RepID=UPI001CBEA74B|nr:GNAT family N-acetyltransferase [Sutcliffiella deserti]
MIVELKQKDFYMCKGLLDDNGQLEARAVVEGVNPGRVFVDDSINPVTGVIWLGNNDGFIFIGDEGNEKFNSELNNFIDEVILEEAKKVGLEWFEGIGNHPKWDSTIEKIFVNRKLGSWNQRVYRLNKEDFIMNLKLEVDEGYEVRRINSLLVENRGGAIENIGFLQSKISETWTSAEDFFKKGIGYCVVHDNQLVSLCLSGFVVGNVHCIDIVTLDTHRGRRLAQLAAHHFVKECMEKNHVPYWDCMEKNKPSIAVAEKLGFQQTGSYRGYEFVL